MEVGYWQRGKPRESCSLNFGQEVCGKSGEERGGGFEYHQFTLPKTLIFGCQNIEISLAPSTPCPRLPPQPRVASVLPSFLLCHPSAKITGCSFRLCSSVGFCRVGSWLSVCFHRSLLQIPKIKAHSQPWISVQTTKISDTGRGKGSENTENCTHGPRSFYLIAYIPRSIKESICLGGLGVGGKPRMKG